MAKKIEKRCSVGGVVGTQVIGGKRISGICPKSVMGGKCGAHGNKKCEFMVKGGSNGS